MLARLFALVLALSAAPALGAASWNAAQIGPGDTAAFTFGGSDAGDAQPALRAAAGPLWLTAEIGATAAAVSFYSCPPRGNASQTTVAGGVGSDAPATDCSLLAVVTVDSRSPQQIILGPGQVLDVDIDTDGDGGVIYVIAAGLARGASAQPLTTDGSPGTRWLQDAQLPELAASTRRPTADPFLGRTDSAGWESCFYDFTDPNDFTVGRHFAYSGRTATSPAGMSFPALTGLSGTATYNPASLADGAGATTTVTVTGAALGDYVEAVSFSLDLQGITLTGWVSAANTVSVRFQNESGGVLDLASGTLSAHVRGDDPLADATAIIPATWGRFDVGSPVNVALFGNRASGTGNQIDARATFSTDTNATGSFFFNSNCGFGTSAGTPKRRIGAIWRILRGGGTATNSCWFVGFSNLVLGVAAPLTSACAVDASVSNKWFGVYSTATADIRVGMNQSNSFTLNYDSGYDTPANQFIIVEMRMQWEDGDTFSGAGWVDFYVNGKLLAQAGRAHSIEPADMGTAFQIASDPMSLTFGMVRIDATGGAPQYALDYAGAVYTRQFQAATP